MSDYLVHQLRSDLAQVRAELDALRGERGPGMPFEFRADADGGARFQGEQRSSVLDTVKSSFGIRKTDTLEITMTQGAVYFKGVEKIIADWPTNGVVDVTTNRFGWLTIDLTDGSVAYVAGEDAPGDGDDDEEIVPIWEVTVADGSITEIVQCHPSDIHVYGNA